MPDIKTPGTGCAIADHAQSDRGHGRRQSRQFSFTLEQQEDFAFLIRFDQDIPLLPADSLEHLDRVLDQFEDFCVVTQSVRSGFPVSVTVRDGDGAGRVIKPA